MGTEQCGRTSSGTVGVEINFALRGGRYHVSGVTSGVCYLGASRAAGSKISRFARRHAKGGPDVRLTNTESNGGSASRSL